MHLVKGFSTEVPAGLGFKGREYEKATKDFQDFGDVSAEAVNMNEATVQALAVDQAESHPVCVLSFILTKALRDRMNISIL